MTAELTLLPRTVVVVRGYGEELSWTTVCASIDDALALVRRVGGLCRSGARGEDWIALETGEAARRVICEFQFQAAAAGFRLDPGYVVLSDAEIEAGGSFGRPGSRPLTSADLRLEEDELSLLARALGGACLKAAYEFCRFFCFIAPRIGVLRSEATEAMLLGHEPDDLALRELRKVERISFEAKPGKR